MKSKKKKSNIVGVFALVFCFFYLMLCCSSERSNESQESQLDRYNFLEKGKIEIMQLEPGISDEIISHDISVIKNIYGNIEKKFEANEFQTEDAKRVVFLVWKGMREKDVSGSFSGDMVMMQIDRYGKLFVDSEPDGAGLRVDEEEWPKTDTSDWIQAGNHQIQLEKNGYKDVQRSLLVTAGVETKVFIQLENIIK